MINTIKQKETKWKTITWNISFFRLTDWCCFPFYHFDLNVIRSTAHIGNKKLGIYIEYHETKTEKESNFVLLFLFSLQLATVKRWSLQFHHLIVPYENLRTKNQHQTVLFSLKKFLHCCIKSTKNKRPKNKKKKKNYTCSSQTIKRKGLEIKIVKSPETNGKHNRIGYNEAKVFFLSKF